MVIPIQVAQQTNLECKIFPTINLESLPCLKTKKKKEKSWPSHTSNKLLKSIHHKKWQPYLYFKIQTQIKNIKIRQMLLDQVKCYHITPLISIDKHGIYSSAMSYFTNERSHTKFTALTDYNDLRNMICKNCQ